MGGRLQEHAPEHQEQRHVDHWRIRCRQDREHQESDHLPGHGGHWCRRQEGREELEMTKMKLTARLTEAEAAIDNLNAKLAQVEKAKAKIAGEINEMTTSLD